VIVPSFHLSIQWGIRGKQGGFLEDPLLISGIREYQPGDEWRKLNWRASARTGKLQTNIYQPVVIKQLFFYVDVQHFMLNETAYDDPIKQKAYRVKQKEAFERFLSIIASVAMRYKEQGVSLGLATNALNHMGQKMSHTACQPNITPFLDQLAQMTPRVGLKGMDVLDRLMVQRKLSLPFFIFCGQVTKAHHTWYEKHKDQIDHIQFFYMENSEHAQQLRETAKAIDSLLA
jgi:hypothetical protein